MTADLETRINLQIYEDDNPPTVPVGAVTRLPGVGFHPWMEVGVLRQDFLKAQETKEDSKDILEKWLIKARKNLVGYWQEYLDQRLVLPIDLEIAEVDGQKRIVSGGVKNAIWIDAIGSWERNGSVKESAIKIEEFLVNAPPLSAAVLMSPGGHEYPDTQTYIFWVNQDGDIDSMTVRTDPNIDDNESFLFNTKSNFNPDTRAPLHSRVETIIRNPLLLAAENGYGFSPESIIETIRATKNYQEAFKGKKFTELFSDFTNRNELLEAGKLVETVINEFTNFCTRTVVDSNYNLNEIYSLIEEKLGETVLKMSYIKRHLQEQKLGFHIAVHRLNNLNTYDYQNELRYLQTIPGCAGGGLISYIENGFGFRELKDTGKFVRNCGNCGTPINTIISKGYICPKCGGIYEGC